MVANEKCVLHGTGGNHKCLRERRGPKQKESDGNGPLGDSAPLAFYGRCFLDCGHGLLLDLPDGVRIGLDDGAFQTVGFGAVFRTMPDRTFPDAAADRSSPTLCARESL